MRKFSCTHWSMWGVRREEWAFQGWGLKVRGTLQRGLLSILVLLPIPKSHWSTREKVLKSCVCAEPRADGVPLCRWFLLSSRRQAFVSWLLKSLQLLSVFWKCQAMNILKRKKNPTTHRSTPSLLVHQLLVCVTTDLQTKAGAPAPVYF